MPPKGADQCNFKQLGWRRCICMEKISAARSQGSLNWLASVAATQTIRSRVSGRWCSSRFGVKRKVAKSCPQTTSWKWLKTKLSKAKFQSFKIAMIEGRKTCAFLCAALSFRKSEWRNLSKTTQPRTWLKLSAWGVPLLLSWYRGLSILVLKVVHLPSLCVCLLSFYCMTIELNLLIFARPIWRLASRSIAAKRQSGIVLSAPGRIWRFLLLWLHRWAKDAFASGD